MYSPVQDGIEKTAEAVRYAEATPSNDLSKLVHCFWELKTDSLLAENFCLHALPDACVNILFNQEDTTIAGITALHTSAVMLNLGKSFHYVGIQFLPGVWHGAKREIVDHFVGTCYRGQLPLINVNNQLTGQDFQSKQAVLSTLVVWLVEKEFVQPNAVVEKILTNVHTINTVADMAMAAQLSTRQLQRTLKQTTGFSPHDLLKVMRLQQSFKQHFLDLYSDQPHFINSFRKLTGYTPTKFANKFDV